MALLQLGEVTIQHVVVDYVCLVIDLLAVEDVGVFRQCLRIIAVLSSNMTLLETVMESDVIAAVTRIVESRDDLPMDVCKDAAKYLSNICRPLSLEYMKKLMDELVPVTILKLMQVRVLYPFLSTVTKIISASMYDIVATCRLPSKISACRRSPSAVCRMSCPFNRTVSS